ncbi:Crp/Fnr family transcriptional regulator [Acuticoccus kandeliae]|uniref:Crp/Fnr family transcriptional regulator n=1 Tax=Acuticoccus kandeliae TaxID=2073160 RepID=UPI000D3EAA9C|nr:Crp/Fnr family transcriptional regulator [Acuticoccus kandeliae]
MAAIDEPWTDRFEGLRTLSPEIRDALVSGSQIMSLPRGTVVFEPGQRPKFLLLLLDGTVRVQQRSDTGRDVFLYRVHAGESCVLTTACLLAYEDYSADAVAETDITAVGIPRALFEDLVGRSKEFREFIFNAYSRRITDLFLLIDEIVFKRIDVRLAARLLAMAEPGGIVKATHQMLATELGTAREVISRTLQDFQKRGIVEQARGELRILDADRLHDIAEH